MSIRNLTTASRRRLSSAPFSSYTNEERDTTIQQPLTQSIRLVSAIPSAAGPSSEAGPSFIPNQSFDEDDTPPSPPAPALLAPKTKPSRTRLVPKKSKLFSRDHGSDSQRGGRPLAQDPFAVHVDPDTIVLDEDIGEMVMIRKQKSRAALDGMVWASPNDPTSALEPVTTNVPKLSSKKSDDKWWNLSRNRKDFKEDKENDLTTKDSWRLSRRVTERSNTPDPSGASQGSRSRFNPVSASILTNTPKPKSSQEVDDAGTPTPTIRRRFDSSATAAPHASGQGSIALRAMRSVRSIARIGSWNQLKDMDKDKENQGTVKKKGSVRKKSPLAEVDETTPVKKKAVKKKVPAAEGEEPVKKKKTVKKKASTAEGEEPVKIRRETSTLRKMISSTTFNPEVPVSSEEPQVTKKKSILGMGLPSSLRLATARSASIPTSALAISSSSSSLRMQHTRSASVACSTLSPAGLPVPAPITEFNRLSLDSSRVSEARSSTFSRSSSFRPSTASRTTGRLSSGSTASIRWDEQVLQSVKEQRNKERAEKSERRASRDASTSRQSGDARRRPAISSVFPDLHSLSVPEENDESCVDDGTTTRHCGCCRKGCFPVLSLEESTDDRRTDLPALEEKKVKPLRIRPRPVSEDMLGRTRPKPIHQSEDGVLNVLDAATDDLALLIKTLDLEATPGTTPGSSKPTPLRPMPLVDVSKPENASMSAASVISPLKIFSKTLPSRENTSSITSLRPYSQPRSSTGTSLKKKRTMELLGKSIPAWPNALSPLKEAKDLASSTSSAITVRPESKSATISKKSVKHTEKRRSHTPAPEPDSGPITRSLNLPPRLRPPPSSFRKTQTPVRDDDDPIFGSDRSSVRTASARSSTTEDSLDFLLSQVPASGSLTPVFQRMQEEDRRRSSIGSIDSRSTRASNGSSVSAVFSLPPGKNERQVRMSMPRTLGGSDDYADMGQSDVDSDVPDELKDIIRAQALFSSSVEEDQSIDEALLRADDEDESVELGRCKAPDADFETPSFCLYPEDSSSGVPLDLSCLSDPPSPAQIGSEEDTKKSFDFTGELNKLNNVDYSARESFAEQLENAFRTPAKIDLRCGSFGSRLLTVEVPPVTAPKLPIEFRRSMEERSLSRASQLDDDEGDSASEVEMSRRAGADGNDLIAIEREEYQPTFQFDEFSATPFDDLDKTKLDVEGLNCFFEGRSSNELSLPSFSPEPSHSHALSASSSRPGELNLSFRFGGLRKDDSSIISTSSYTDDAPLTLSDIIPPPDRARTISMSSQESSDRSVTNERRPNPSPAVLLAPPTGHSSRLRVNSGSSGYRAKPRSVYRGASRPASDVSFQGFESYDEVRRGFEFAGDHRFYPATSSRDPNAAYNRDAPMGESSVAPSPSYSQSLLRPGAPEPSDYTGPLPSLRERPSSEDMSVASFSMEVEDTFEFRFNLARRRQRVDSDTSSIYLKAPRMNTGLPAMSSRIFGRSRKDSNGSEFSGFSIAVPSIKQAWASSVDSLMSESSAHNVARPGIGDKMFDSRPLPPIDASPSSSLGSPFNEQDFRLRSNRTQYDETDSLFEGATARNPRASIEEDSLFDKAGYRSSEGDSVFGHDEDHAHVYRSGPQFRPVSVYSLTSEQGVARTDDTMISMLGGGHVNRSFVDASPCPRVEKKKHVYAYSQSAFEVSPNKTRIVQRSPYGSPKHPSGLRNQVRIASESMIEDDRSPDKSTLSAQGEGASPGLFKLPVFTRPPPPGRSRSNTCTSASSGIDTPPLLASDARSISEMSDASSLDLTHVSFELSDLAHPTSTSSAPRPRPVTRRNHERSARRKRYSITRNSISRSSAYETIQEEVGAGGQLSRSPSSLSRRSVFIVDADADFSDHEHKLDYETASVWSDERGILALHRYYALREEAENTVSESRKAWHDTPISMFALQSFEPPKTPTRMQALLEHSLKSFQPLPSDLRPRRVRTTSRPSPYPQSHVNKATMLAEQIYRSARVEQLQQPTPASSVGSPERKSDVLRPVFRNPNIEATMAKLTGKTVTNVHDDSASKHDSSTIRARVKSGPRRGAPPSSMTTTTGKENTGTIRSSKANLTGKENFTSISTGSTMMTSGDSLRITRPRPKARPSLASIVRPVRI